MRALSDRTLPLGERLQAVEEATPTDLERVYRVNVLAGRLPAYSDLHPFELQRALRGLIAPPRERATQLGDDLRQLTARWSDDEWQDAGHRVSFIWKVTSHAGVSNTCFVLPSAFDRGELLDLCWEQVEPSPLGEPCDPDLARLLHTAYWLGMDNEYDEENYALHLARFRFTASALEARQAEEEASLREGAYPSPSQEAGPGGPSRVGMGWSPAARRRAAPG